jgi:hypothetical protein
VWGREIPPATLVVDGSYVVSVMIVFSFTLLEPAAIRFSRRRPPGWCAMHRYWVAAIDQTWGNRLNFARVGCLRLIG